MGVGAGTRTWRADVLFAWFVGVVGLGAIVAVAVLDRSHLAHLPLSFWLLASGCVVGDLVGVRFDEWSDFSPRTPYAFAILLAFGLAPALAALVFGSVVADVARRWRAPIVLLNAAQFGLTWPLAAGVLALAGLSWEPSVTRVLHASDVPVVAAAGLVLFAANGVVIQAYVALRAQQSLIARLRQRLGFFAAEYATALALGTVMTITAPRPGAVAPLLVLPLIGNLGTRHTEVHERLASHDTLTGLLNRAAFGERVGLSLSHTSRERGAVLVLDLDGFKEVNDTFGHHAGDEVLVAFAERLRGALRTSDAAARIGGDEFAVLLPRSTPDGTRRVVAALAEAVARPIDVQGQRVVLGVSIGAAHYPDDGETVDRLVDCADARMYTEKAAHANPHGR